MGLHNFAGKCHKIAATPKKKAKRLEDYFMQWVFFSILNGQNFNEVQQRMVPSISNKP